MSEEIPIEVSQFREITAECRKLYKGEKSDIGDWIYSHKKTSNIELLNLAKDCLYRIKKGISIKRKDDFI